MNAIVPVTIASTLLALLLLAGCGNPAEVTVKGLFRPSPDKDVTTDPNYNFSPFTNTIWKTRTKTAIADIKRYTGAHDIRLIPPEFFDPAHSNYARYTPIPDLKMIAVLPPGARLRIERLMKDQGASGGVHVEAVLLDGTNAQKAVFLDSFFLANVWWSAKGPTSNTNWGPEPEMLEKP